MKNTATHNHYYDGAMPKGEEQATSDWKLSEADESSGCVVDGTVRKLNRRTGLGTCVSTRILIDSSCEQRKS